MQVLGRHRERKKESERKTDRQSESERQEEIAVEDEFIERKYSDRENEPTDVDSV